MSFDTEYANIRKAYRLGVTRALEDIRRGVIDETDLDKLSNFCMVSLALMAKVNKATWRNAENNADLADYLYQVAEQGNENGKTTHEMASATCDSGLLGSTDAVESVEDTGCKSDSGTSS